MRLLLLLLVLAGMVGANAVYAQITANGHTGTSTTAYTNGMPNDPIYIWCNYGIGTNGASLTATPPSGTGPWTFRWYYHNQATAAWALYTTTTGTTSTISNLPSDGYRVEIFSSTNVLVGCYTAWAWNMNATIDVAANPSACNASTLGGTLNVASSFSYYNPPPPESIITAATQITVCFRANHTYVSDLAFYLVGPASCGSPVILLSPNPGAIGQNNICNSGNNVNNLCFQKGSTATLNVCTSGVPLSGTYGRYGPGNTAINWTPLNGCNAAAGGWRVQIYDCIGQDVGALTNATISFSNLTPVCGSPTTINYNSGNISSAINDNSCSAATASIFQVPPATALTTPITINANTSYQWTASPAMTIPNSTSSLSPSVTNIPTGTTTFTLTATVSYGGVSCTYTDSAPFTNTCCTAVANAGADIAFCSGGSGTIGSPAVPGRTYSWSPTTGLSSSTVAQPTVTLTNGGATPQTTNYTLTVTNTVDGGCTANDQVAVTVNPTPVVTATPANQTICSGTVTGIALTSAPAGSTFAWTVAQSGLTGASNGNGASIAQTLTATGATAGTATYTITPTIGTCPGTPVTVTITVNPTPVVTATPANQTICSGTAPNISLTSVPAGATFNWTVTQTGVTGTNNGNGTFISQTLTATGAGAGTATYVVTPTIGSCPGTPITIPITVNPAPAATATPANQTICSGTATGIALTSVPAGATFSWTVVESGVTGASNGNGTSINQPLNTSGGTSGTATYTITPTIGTCPGAPITVTITVNPTPVVAATPANQTICSGTAPNIALTSVPAGATFNWTISQTGASGASNGTGTSINQTLTATGSVAGNVTYSVVPSIGTCPGTPLDVPITVNPTPVVTATPMNQAICSGTATGIALTSVPAGATFDWTVVESGVTGASAGNGPSIAQTLTASGTSSGTATYTITPIIGTCPGLPVAVIITVNPTPVVAATPVNQTICSGTAASIALTSVPAGATFDWTAVEAGVTGASNGSGTSIAQTLTATGAAAGTATYTVIPTIGACPGLPITVPITVNPTPVATATPANQAICSGTATGIALTSVPAGATFDWTVVQTGVTGAIAGNGSSIAQTLTATGTAAGTATYTVTPTIGTCPGLPVTVVITVNPTPVATATPSSQSICSGTSTGILLTSVPAGATFDWTVVQSGTTGASAGSGTNIAQVLSTAGVTGTATYTITPTLGVCLGTPINVLITVNPTPVVTATPASQSICSGTSTGIVLTSAPAGATFDWTVVQSGTNGASAGTGSNISQTLNTSGTAAGTATYSITPTIGTCPGTPVNVMVTVNPTPVVTATPASQAICSGTSTGIALTSVPAGATFDWTVAQSGTTGASAGNGANINQVLSTAGVIGTATYTITPTLGVCPGTPINVVITVNPTPAMTATPTSQAICSGTAPSITLTSVPAGATFSWTISQTGASGASNGTGNTISQTLTATGTTAGTVVYTVIPTIGTCPGSPVDVTITVNPTPVVTATPASQTICSGTSTGIALTSVPTGATFNWTVVQSGTTGATAGSGASINQTLNTSGTVAGTATYTVTPTLGVCPGTPINVVITVNPTPVVTATPTSQTICSGTAPNIALSSVPTGSTFNWTVAQAGTTGASAGSGSAISQTLNTSGTTAGTATYTITPMLGVCPGTPTTVTITVNPTPIVTATPASQTICSGTAPNIALSSVPAGASFDWTVVQSATTGASAGSGANISQTLTTAAVTGTATYTVTPTLGACPGTPINVAITVNPTPVVTATPASQAICSGTSMGIALTSVPAGATFNWTVVQSGTTGASAGTGTSIAQVLSTAGAIGTATYTITPTLGTCPGTPISVAITVNPTPVVTATPASQTICSGTSTGIALTSVPTGATFNWTVAESGTSGASAGTGASIAQVLSTAAVTGTATYTIMPSLGTCQGAPINVIITVNPTPVVTATPASQTICSGTAPSIALTSVPTGSTFNWTVLQSGTTGASAGSGTTINQTLSTAAVTGTATYTVTPTLGVCAGTPIDVAITVNPTPVATATPANQTICAGTAPNIALTSVPAGATFNWTVAQSGTTGASAGSGTSIGQTLNTSGTVAGTATYTVTPTVGVCPGAPVTVVITVNPTPVVTATPASQTICSGTAPSIALTSVPAGATFDWTVVQSATTGASAGSGANIAQVLSTAAVTGTATYTVVPTLGVCAGTTIDVVVTVNPTPVASATPINQTICSGTVPNIAFTSVPAGATFDWTVAQSGATGASAGNGTSIGQTLTATGNTAGTATYSISPTTGTCLGSPITVAITVNPTPVVSATPASQTICSGTAPSIALTSVPAGATFDWTVVQSGTTGASAGTGNNIGQILTATAAATGTATYSVVPTLNGCAGLPVDVIITVNPLPTVVATPVSYSICSGQATGIALTSMPAGSTFTWTASQSGATGSANGSGASIVQTLTSSAGGTVTYSVTPSLAGCVGPVSMVPLIVNPNPVLVASPSLPSICAGSSVTLNVTGAVNYGWTPATGLNTTTGSSVNASPAATQGYAIQGTDANGCQATTNVIVTVNPMPVTAVSPGDTICAGESMNLSASGAASYVWSPATGLNTTTGPNVVATPASTTTYTVTGTSLGCSTNATVTVMVNSLPVVSAGADITVCNGETVVLAGSGAVSYIWSNGINNGVGFVPSATTTYTVVGTGQNGCTANDNVTVTVVNAPIINVVPSTTAGCAPVNLSFQNNTQGAATYSWDFGDGTTSTVATPNHTYLSTGCFDVTLTASTVGGCTSIMTFPSMVCVENSPIAAFIANPTSITLGNPVSSMVNLSENASSYSWDFGDGSTTSNEFSPTHTFPDHSITNYEVTLVAYSTNGCTDTAWARIEMYEDVLFFVPNSFTPDGDDYNQTFKPVFTSGFDPYAYTLLIYNRWGQVMFESHDASVGWEGTYGEGNEIVMDGTYSYTIEFKVLQTGERKKINGHVNILR